MMEILRARTLPIVVIELTKVEIVYFHNHKRRWMERDVSVGWTERLFIFNGG